MSSPTSNLFKLLLIAPILVFARPSDRVPRSNSDEPSQGKHSASPNQITPYPIWWPYTPAQYHEPIDPRNEETRWGRPVQPPQPDHTRGSKQDPAGKPAKRPDYGSDWWKGKDSNCTSSDKALSALARLDDGETEPADRYHAVEKLPSPSQQRDVRGSSIPATYHNVPTHTVLSPSRMSDEYAWSLLQPNGATTAEPESLVRRNHDAPEILYPRTFDVEKVPTTTVENEDAGEVTLTFTNDGTPATYTLPVSVFPKDFNWAVLAKAAVPNETNLPDQIPDASLPSKHGANITLTFTNDGTPATYTLPVSVFPEGLNWALLGQVPYPTETPDPTTMPDQAALAVKKLPSTLENPQGPDVRLTFTNDGTPATYIIPTSVFPGDFNWNRLRATGGASANDDPSEPQGPDPQVQARLGRPTTDDGQDNGTATSDLDTEKNHERQDMVTRARDVYPHGTSDDVFWQESSTIDHLQDRQIKSRLKPRAEKASAWEKIALGAEPNELSVKHTQDRHIQAADDAVTIALSDSTLSHIDDGRSQSSLNHHRDGADDMPWIQVGQQLYGPISHQISDGQIQDVEATPVFVEVPNWASQLPDGQVQTKRRRRNEKISESDAQRSVLSGSIPDQSSSEVARTAPAKRRKMQSMIDNQNEASTENRQFPGVSGCQLPVSEFMSISLQTSVIPAAHAAGSPDVVVRDSRKRDIGVAAYRSLNNVVRNRFAKDPAPTSTVKLHSRMSADDQRYQDLSDQAQPGNGRVKLVCLVWVLVFVLLGILEFL